MSFSGTPVKIPKVPGKITLREYNDRTYVAYEIGRSYNSARKNTNPIRKNIGLQIRNAPTMMLPNENYEIYFAQGEEKMTETEAAAARDYDSRRKEFRMLNSLFDQLYFEFTILAHKSPHNTVNAYKIQRINKVLGPLREMMKNEPYGEFLVELHEPGEPGEEDGISAGLDYSDVALALTQYKGAMTRFSADQL